MTKFNIQCEQGHTLFLASYRKSSTIRRIKDLFYCPTCDEFYKLKSDKIKVTIK